MRHGDCPALEVVAFPPGELVVRHLPAQHWLAIPTIPGLWFWRAGPLLAFIWQAPVFMLYEVRKSTGDTLAEGVMQVDVRSCWCVPRIDRACPMVL